MERRTASFLGIATSVLLALLVAACSFANPVIAPPNLAPPAHLATSASPTQPNMPSPAIVTGFLSTESDLLIYVPTAARTVTRPRVLVALHGFGGNGPSFGREFVEEADRRGWVLVAPTFHYRDIADPDKIRQDDVTFAPRLKALLDELPVRTGLAVAKRAHLFGFSRGAQMAHRFALFYPKQVSGVASLAAGTYTLPMRTLRVADVDTSLPLPYGLADVEQQIGSPGSESDLRAVSFWVAVGGRDNRVADVPRSWDALVGKDRVERATEYSRILTRFGAATELAVFPDAGHEVTPAMRKAGCKYLGDVDRAGLAVAP